MEITLFSALAYFIIYSFLGWILESIFRSFCEKKIINTGFLIGPVCPIYGAGAILMLLTMGKLKGNIIAIFFVSILMLTLWEYLVGVLLEKAFKTKYWDYSDHKINFQGRICLTNSIAWGFLGVGFINYVHPFINSFIEKWDSSVFTNVIYTSIAIIIIDTIVSVIKAKHINIELNKVKELTEEIKQKTVELKASTKTKMADKNKISENIQLTVEKLKKKRNRMIRKLYRRVYRLKKTFPAMNTKEITEILSEKFSIKKDSTKDKRRK